MADPKIVEYIKQNTANGHSPDSVKEHLLSQGTDPDEVDDAMSEFEHGRIKKRLEDLEKKPNKFVLLVGLVSLVPLFMLFLTYLYSEFNGKSQNLVFINLIMWIALILLWIFDTYLVYFEARIKDKSYSWISLPLFFGPIGTLVYYYLSTKKK